MQLKNILLTLVLLFSGALFSGLSAPPETRHTSQINPDNARSILWAKQVLDTLTLDEKLGQLFMIPAYSNKDTNHVTRVLKLILQEKVGGLIMMQGGPLSQTHLTNMYQRNSDLPLLISQDAEWGPSMRLDSVIKFPRNLTLGAIRNDSLIYALGKEIALQCKAVGVQVNFSPVTDINNNAANPVINDRSFGEDKENVTRKSIMMMKGLQAGGVMACAKHFPGHGDTDTDSHLDLPVIRHSRARMDSLELYPFRELIREGVLSVMIAHLYLPAFDATPNRASTLSPLIVDTLLRQNLGFKGLIFTDALNMKGVSKFYSKGDAELQAFIAGNDILLFSENIQAGKDKIKAALKAGIINEEQIDEKVMRILAAKHAMGLTEKKYNDTRNTLSYLSRTEGTALKRELYKASVTLASNPDAQIPLGYINGKKIGYISLGSKKSSPFLSYLRQFATVEEIILSAEEKNNMSAEKAKSIAGKYPVIILGLMDMERSAAKQYGIKTWQTTLINQLEKAGSKPLICLFGNPYALRFFTPQQTLLIGYDEEPEAQMAMAEAIFGSIDIQGQLPVGAGKFKALSGIKTKANRLEEALPEETGMSPHLPYKIDSMVQIYIAKGAMPGCALLVQHKGKTIHARGYGNFRYEGNEPVHPYTSRYDLASLTKVCATTLSIMRLYEQSKIHLDSTLGAYLPELKGSDKATLTLRSLLLHTSGLPAFIPMHQQTLLPGKIWKPWAFALSPGEGYRLPVGKNMFIADSWQDSVWNTLISAKLSPEKKFVYSDLGMIFLGKVVERISGKSLDAYTNDNFYAPLGLKHTGFCPWKNPELQAYCPPTENDKIWRKQEVQGYVHDQNAALLNGVSGHAGLFSTVYDLSILMRMLMQEGEYKGNTFFQGQTIQTFTSRQKGSRRGLGWDKPDSYLNGGPGSEHCSSATYGHTGFTGTCIWADPKQEVLYIFLSNRTWPDAENKMLIQEGVRKKIHDIIYNCIISG